MVTAASTLLLLTAGICLVVVFRESAQVNHYANDRTNGRARLGAWMHHVSLAASVVAALLIVLVTLGGQLSAAISALLPWLLALAALCFLAAVGVLLWSVWLQLRVGR